MPVELAVVLVVAESVAVGLVAAGLVLGCKMVAVELVLKMKINFSIILTFSNTKKNNRFTSIFLLLLLDNRSRIEGLA